MDHNNRIDLSHDLQELYLDCGLEEILEGLGNILDQAILSKGEFLESDPQKFEREIISLKKKQEILLLAIKKIQRIE